MIVEEFRNYAHVIGREVFLAESSMARVVTTVPLGEESDFGDKLRELLNSPFCIGPLAVLITFIVASQFFSQDR